MALITCKECGKQISDKAEVCLDCGCPIQSRSILTKSLGFGGFIYTLLIIIGVLLVVSINPFGWILIIIGALLLFVRLKIWSGVGKK